MMRVFFLIIVGLAKESFRPFSKVLINGLVVGDGRPAIL